MQESGQMIREIAFEIAASSVRFGAGVTREVGMDLVDLGVRRALVVTDPNLTRLAPVHTVLTALDEAGVEAVLYDPRRDPFRRGAPGRRYRGGGRGIGDRHSQGGDPLHDLSAGGFLLKNYHAPGYPGDHPLVPHGISVILNAPAVFRFTAAASPARHLQAAEALGANVTGAKEADAGKILADRLTWFMERLGVPNGLKAVGYTSADIAGLVEGTLPQHRVTKLSPRPAGPDELAALFEDAMVAW